METNRLVLEDSEGRVLRTFQWEGARTKVIRRGDTRRLELVTDTQALEKKKIPFEDLGEIEKGGLSKKPFLVGQLGHLRLIEEIRTTVKDEELEGENQRLTSLMLLGLFVLAAALFTVVSTRPLMTPKIEEELKQQVVKITKRMTPVEKAKINVTQNANVPSETKTTRKVEAVKRSGALAALGSLQNGKQRGGLNLGAAKVTGGPGLGGTGGSGGVQTSLYARGITSAPLGPGANVQGAGGYGTKGKGGGQEGYGKLTLVGSTGAAPIPLGHEATVANGLDRDAIAAVIQKNLGQVRFCYEQGLQSDPALNGRVAIGFTIGGNGLVKSASIENTTLNAKAVEDCLMLRLKSWKFPLPDGGVDVKVSYPFVLRRAGQG